MSNALKTVQFVILCVLLLSKYLRGNYFFSTLSYTDLLVKHKQEDLTLLILLSEMGRYHVSCTSLYTQHNKNSSVRNFLSPKPEVTCGTVAIIIRVVLLSPYLRIRGVSVFHSLQSITRRIYEPNTTIHLLNLKLKH
jgi:hypothetical protein